MRVPKYRLHKATGQAVVTLNGKDHYLGKHGSDVSRSVYDRLIAEFLSNGRVVPKNDSGTLIVELCVDFMRYAEKKYRNPRNGKPTSEISLYRRALACLRRLYGDTPANEFKPPQLVAVRSELAKGSEPKEGKPRKIPTHVTLNKYHERIVRVFLWAKKQGMVGPGVYAMLKDVDKVGPGEIDGAAIPDRVLPVDEKLVLKTVAAMPRIPADMVRMQLLTGARSSEICFMTPGEVDRTSEVWTYSPKHHKTSKKGKERTIYIGSDAQKILAPYLLRESNSFCFSPRESVQENYRASRKTHNEDRKTRKAKNKTSRKIRDHYDAGSYRQAIQRTCRKLKIKCWKPHQLRHTHATKIRKLYGIEAARILLGHSSLKTVEIYAEVDRMKAIKISKEVG